MIRWAATFLGIPTWPIWLAVAGLIGAAFLATYTKGYLDARDRCQEAQLRAEIAGLKRDIAALKAADEVEAMLTQELEAERQRLAKEVEDYEAELAQRPDTRCTLSPADVDRLSGKRKQ